MRIKAILAAVVGFALATSAQAATITYSLVTGVNSTGVATTNAFVVFGTVSTGDNAGLSGFNVSLANVLTVANRAPQQGYQNNDPDGDVQFRSSGFSLLRTASADQLAGAVDTVSGDGVIVYGFGRTGGDLKNLTPSGFSNSNPQNNQVFEARLLLASGTFTVGGLAPSIVAGTGNVFTMEQNGVAIPASITLVDPVVSIPEPASLALIGLGGIGLLARRRKA